MHLPVCRGQLVVTNVATPSRPPTSQTARRGKVEIIKENSDYLRHPLMQVRLQQLALLCNLDACPQMSGLYLQNTEAY